jgi:transcriptional regulator with XRE-family HTH domain
MSEIHIKLGKLLQLERQRRNLSLADMAVELKITETNLERIENGDVGALPGELFFNLFAKSYAEALGIDYAKTMDAIREDMGESIEAPAGAESGGESDEGRDEKKPLVRAELGTGRKTGMYRMNPATIFTTVLVVAILVLAWYLFKDQTKVSLLEKGKQVLNAIRSDSGTEPSASKSQIANLNLRLVARDHCWATVLADGDTALAMNLKPGRDYTVGAQDKLQVSLSMPLAVDVFLNSKRVDLSDPEKGTVEKVVVTLSNMNLFIKEPSSDTSSSDTVGFDDSDAGADGSVIVADTSRKVVAPVTRTVPRDTAKGVGR